jgi:hypothetical protein
LRFIPVAGWVASGVTAFISGQIGVEFLCFGANVLFMAGMIAYILLSHPGYYEHVDANEVKARYSAHFDCYLNYCPIL